MKRYRAAIVWTAVSLCVLGGSVWWWSASRIDPRLVGVWKEAAEPGRVWNGRRYLGFRSDGYVDDIAFNPGKTFPMTGVAYTWSVSDEVLSLRPHVPPSAGQGRLVTLIRSAFDKWGRATGSARGNYDLDFRVSTVEPNRLILILSTGKGDGTEVVMDRVDW